MAKRATWKDVLRRALSKSGGRVDLPSIYAAIPKSRRRTKTWESTVRRTLQELRDAGEIGFQSGQYPRKRGQYLVPITKTASIEQELTDELSASFDVVSSRVTPTVYKGRHKGQLRNRDDYEFRFANDSEDTLLDVRSVEAAVKLLEAYYPNHTTIVSILVSLRDAASVEIGQQWMSLGPRTISPTVAAQQLVFAYRTHSQESKYAEQEVLIGLSISVDEDPRP